MAYTYKIEDVEPPSAADYAVRYSEDESDAYAKHRGGEEFKTDIQVNDTAYDTLRNGVEVSQEEYEAF